MATEINMVQGDTAPDRIFTITRDGNPVDLTGASVHFHITDTGNNEQTNTGHSACTIDADPTTGRVTYSFQSGDIASNSVHFGDLVTTYDNDQVETDFERVIIRTRMRGTIS